MGKLLLAAGAAAIVLTLTGCIEPTPRVTAPPTPSATPVFASDEEALAAAEEAYAAYLEIADQIFAEGGANPERLGAVASGDFLEASLLGFKDVRDNGWHSVGRSAIHSIELQYFDPSRESSGVISVYLCDDVSAVDVVDSNGLSVVSPDRPDRTLFEITFDLAPSSELLVSSREVWSDGRC